MASMPSCVVRSGVVVKCLTCPGAATASERAAAVVASGASRIATTSFSPKELAAGLLDQPAVELLAVLRIVNHLCPGIGRVRTLNHEIRHGNLLLLPRTLAGC